MYGHDVKREEKTQGVEVTLNQHLIHPTVFLRAGCFPEKEATREDKEDTDPSLPETAGSDQETAGEKWADHWDPRLRHHSITTGAKMRATTRATNGHG